MPSPPQLAALSLLAGLIMFWTGLLLRPPPPGIDMDEVATTDPRLATTAKDGDRVAPRPVVATYPLPDALQGGTNPEPELLFDKRPLVGKIQPNVPDNPLFTGALALPTTPISGPFPFSEGSGGAPPFGRQWSAP
jgi:hypothetical protein